MSEGRRELPALGRVASHLGSLPPLFKGRVKCFPAVLGAFAGWSVLNQAGNPLGQAVVSFVALIEGLFPALYTSLKIDRRVDQCTRLEAEYTNLGDRFRQAALNATHKSSPESETEFRPLMTRLEAVRRESEVPPDWCLKRAQAKITQSRDRESRSKAA